jgi:hypothetical protein
VQWISMCSVYTQTVWRFAIISMIKGDFIASSSGTVLVYLLQIRSAMNINVLCLYSNYMAFCYDIYDKRWFNSIIIGNCYWLAVADEKYSGASMCCLHICTVHNASLGPLLSAYLLLSKCMFSLLQCTLTKFICFLPSDLYFPH